MRKIDLLIFSLSVVLFLLNSEAMPQPPKECDIPSLMVALHEQAWPGAAMIGESPTIWDFSLTAPMKKILRCGTQAQDTLLEHITDSKIADQVIFLLGGVGDERAIDPIITALKRASKEPGLKQKKKIVTAGNLALTNITVADVIWHHGGGIVIDKCPENPAECWATWWANHKSTFRVKTITQSRRYSNYPNYGIYGNMP